MRIPALTLFQPWAWAIAAGHKQIENRCWTTSYRGPVLIHAGKKWDEEGAEWMRDCFGLEVPMFGVPHGAVVGVALLEDITDDEYEENPWAIRGSYHWHMARALEFETPIPMRGKLNLWYPDPSAIVRGLTLEENAEIAGLLGETEGIGQ